MVSVLIPQNVKRNLFESDARVVDGLAAVSAEGDRVDIADGCHFELLSLFARFFISFSRVILTIPFASS